MLDGNGTLKFVLLKVEHFLNQNGKHVLLKLTISTRKFCNN